MAVVHGYCTVEQLRAELSDDTSRLSTPLLEKAVNAASRAVDLWCGRRFWQDEEATVRRFRPAAADCAAVKDIASTTGLIVRTDDAGTGSWSTTWTLDADFQLEPLDADADGGAYAWWELVAIGTKRFPCTSRRARLQVTAIFGWSQVPDQVQEATLLRAIALFKRKDAVYGVADFGEFGPVRITRKDPDVIDLLLPFQKVLAA